MAMNTYDFQDNGGYLSTDPNFGMDQGGGVSIGADTNYQWTGGITGQGQGPGPGGVWGDTTGGPTGAPASAGAYSGDYSNVDSWLQWLATQPGHDPILDTPQGRAYYAQRIGETGGLNAQNAAYWQNKGTLSSMGGAVGAPEGGNNTFGGLWNHMPSLSDIQGIPGYQAALDEAQRGYETGAAAKGTLLNGRTQAGLGSYVANKVLSDFYFPFANLQSNMNNSNFSNLYNLGQLGLNASSVGPSSPA